MRARNIVIGETYVCSHFWNHLVRVLDQRASGEWEVEVIRGHMLRQDETVHHVRSREIVRACTVEQWDEQAREEAERQEARRFEMMFEDWQRRSISSMFQGWRQYLDGADAAPV